MQRVSPQALYLLFTLVLYHSSHKFTVAQLASHTYYPYLYLYESNVQCFMSMSVGAGFANRISDRDDPSCPEGGEPAQRKYEIGLH
jgi:hypothetical protein